MSNGGFKLFVPDDLVIQVLDVANKSLDVMVFRPERLSDVKKEIFNECSVAEVSVDTDGCLGQG